MTTSIETVTLTPDGRQVTGTMPARGRLSGPLVSCLMVSRGDRASVAEAIACYRRQSYADRELVIVCGRTDELIRPLLAQLGDPTIRFHQTTPRTLGALRNESVALARGSLLCQWDDDDLCHPRRIELQVAALEAGDAAASFIMRWMLWQPMRRRLALSSARLWEATMLVRRDAMTEYPPLDRGEDAAVVESLRATRRLVAIDVPSAYLYIGHAANTCGAGHFERLLANASAHVPDDVYDAALDELAALLPIQACLERLGCVSPTTV